MCYTARPLGLGNRAVGWNFLVFCGGRSGEPGQGVAALVASLVEQFLLKGSKHLAPRIPRAPRAPGATLYSHHLDRHASLSLSKRADRSNAPVADTSAEWFRF